MDLQKIYKKCFKAIGGRSHEDIDWYFHQRSKTISRQNFFTEAVYAIWAGGKTRKAAQTIMKNAEVKGFNWNYNIIGSWNKQKLRKFAKKLYGRPPRKGAYKRWESIHNIAKQIKTFKSERIFCTSYFDGKVKSADLDDGDVLNLTSRNFSFIRETNARFILRNMGGEFIKDDIWLKVFMNNYKTSLIDLKKRLKILNIPLGLFDAVIWLYCVEYVKKTKDFKAHFKKLFA